MATIGPRACPHCKVNNSAFSNRAHGFEINRIKKTFFATFLCELCEDPIVCEFSGQNFPFWLSGQSILGDTKLLNTWPEAAPHQAPEHTDKNVARPYVQGLNALKRGDADAAGVMFRKSLDVAVKQLNPAGKGNLKQRINSIPAETGVTPAMKEWAHIIRDEGNDAAHEEEPYTQEDAAALEAFTKVFLTYAFTLPALVKARGVNSEQ